MLPIIVKHRIPEHPEGRPKRGAWNSPLHLCTGGFVTPEHLSQAPALPFPSPALHRMQLGLELLGHLLLLGWLESSVKAGATHTQQNPSSCPRDPCQLILPAPGAARDSSNFCKTRPGPSSWLQIRGWEIPTNPARLCKGLGWDGISSLHSKATSNPSRQISGSRLLPFWDSWSWSSQALWFLADPGISSGLAQIHFSLMNWESCLKTETWQKKYPLE